MYTQLNVHLRKVLSVYLQLTEIKSPQGLDHEITKRLRLAGQYNYANYNSINAG